MAQHTPGPWRANAEFGYDIETADGHFQIATVRDESDDLLLDRQYAPIPSEADANARLIAAAPDLLQALKTARLYSLECQVQHGSTEYVSFHGVLDAAIARAEGR